MDRRVFEAVLKRSVVPMERMAPSTGLRDLEAVQRLLSSPGMAMAADKFAESVREEGEMIQGLGMRGSVLTRWRGSRDKALAAQIQSSDLTGTFSTGSKTFRLFLQSAMLGLGAYLVLQGEMTPGAMIAGSILMGRALSPVEQAIGQWPLVIRARQGWASLSELLAKTPEEPERTELPVPRAILDGQQVTVVPPGEQAATLRMVSPVYRLSSAGCCAL